MLLLSYHLHLDLPSGPFLSDCRIILEVKQVQFWTNRTFWSTGNALDMYSAGVRFE
jgi:hypothetical protein